MCPLLVNHFTHNNVMKFDRNILKKIPNSEDQTCFGCGGKNQDGLQMEFYTDDQLLYSFVEIPKTMAGWGQVVHGGILSTVLDEIMGWGVIYLCKKIGVTNTITVDFVKPVFVEDELTVIGKLEKKESARSVMMSSEIYNSQSVLCVRASAEFKALEPKTALRLGMVTKEYMSMFDPILNFKFEDS